MKQFTIICCFLSLFILSMETAIACDNKKENCKGVESKRKDSLKPESIDLQRDIVAKLFKIAADVVNNKIDHKYNYYGDSCGYHLPDDEEKKCVYQGGHSGWDVRTIKAREGIENPLPVNIAFYSLTNGIVILDGRRAEDNTRGEIKFNTIAIYDEDAHKTTFYLHASDVHPSLVKGKEIKVGDPLGWQGDTGSRGAFHVHLEVQEGKAERASAGTKDAGTQTIDPIPYLHESIQNIKITKLSPASNVFDDVQRIEVGVNQRERFYIKAGSDDGIKSISFVVSGYEQWTRRVRNCRFFCRSMAFAVRYRFRAAKEYTVVATITSETGKVVTREWIVTVQRNPGAPSLAKPQVTTLLPNYPNPFNPETWIPYHLATAGDVQIHISDVRGNVVWSLALGHQAVGHYTSQSRAAYWDGRNELGESVASGVYFYTLTVGDFSATRKLLILK